MLFTMWCELYDILERQFTIKTVKKSMLAKRRDKQWILEVFKAVKIITKFYNNDTCYTCLQTHGIRSANSRLKYVWV